MAKQLVGTVKQLYRYPVKSMGGEAVHSVALGPAGVIGDRLYALRDGSERIASAKRTTQLLNYHARYETPPVLDRPIPPVLISLPNGETLRSDDPQVSMQLSASVGRSLTLERWRSDQQNYGELDAQTIFADVSIAEALEGKKRQLAPDADRFDLAPGTFFDSAHLHLLSTGTLAYLQRLIGSDANTDPRRFRPNILIETEDSLDHFVEDEWLDQRLQIGEGAEVNEIWPTLRCVMTTLPQGDLPKDTRILKTVVKVHQNHLGIFGRTGVSGTISVGDPVWLIQP